MIDKDLLGDLIADTLADEADNEALKLRLLMAITSQDTL